MTDHRAHSQDIFMNQNRISDFKLGRSKHYEKSMALDGVYCNPRLIHATAALLGCVVQIQVRDGTVYEGILQTFSNQLDLVLETAHKVSLKNVPSVGVGPSVSNLIACFPFEDGICGKMIFRLNDIVTLNASNVDTDFAVKDNFTDTAISKFNGQIMEKELEPWDGASSDSENTVLMVDDGDGSNGWDANDMFRTNAEKYGVKSSYDTTMQEYTVALNRKDTEEYKMKEAKASRIAHEIENNMSYQNRLQMENGDEEDRFSAVVRTPDDSGSKYVLPQKRKNNPGSLKRQTSTTISPVHAGGPKSYPPIHSGKQYMHRPPPTMHPPITVPKESLNGEEILEEPPNPPSVTENVSSGPPKPYLLGPQSLPPRIERIRENERKLSKQKGRNDEIEEFRKFSSNFKLTEEVGEVREDMKLDLATQLAEQVNIEKDTQEKTTDISKSTLNPNAKEFVFNPNAKSFTPRSMNTGSPQTGMQRLQAQSPLLVVPHSQMIPGLAQPLFTTMTPQYVVQPFTNPLQPPRFRKVPITMQPRHDVNPSMHVAAATGQPILAPAAMPTHSQLTMQYSTPQGVIHASAPQQQTMGYPQMNFVVGPRVVSPQPVGVVPTSHSVSYCDTSHLPAHLISKSQATIQHFIMSAHPGASMSGGSGGPPQQHSSHPPQTPSPQLYPSPHHFPPSGSHPLVLMPHQSAHMHPQGMMPQMTLIPTSTPYVQQGQSSRLMGV